MGIVQVLFSWFARPGRSRSLTVGGLKRRYYVHVPPQYDPATPAPVVLALHGATLNGPVMGWMTGLNAKADEAGFVAVYPDGTGRFSSYTWNGGAGTNPAAKGHVDDVGFIRAVLDDLPGVVRVDPKRVFATGLSNGAVMAYRLAAELADRIAAIAPVAGTMGAIACRPVRPVSVLHFHGTADEYIPFTGGRGSRSIFGTAYRPVEDTIRAWVRANGCGEPPTTDVLSDGRGGLRVTRRTYGAGRGGAEVALVVVEGGGHTWPGKKSTAPVLGRSALSVSANDLMWEFFQKHESK